MVRICEKCLNKHYGKYGSGRFCSQKCARSFSSLNQINFKKKSKCLICKKEIFINKRAQLNKTKCLKCRQIKICFCCGQDPCLRPDICKKFQVFPALIKYFGFNKNVIKTKKVYEEFERIKNKIEEDYWDKELTLIEMSKIYKHKNIRNFYKILKSIEIKTRNISESLHNAAKKGRISFVPSQYRGKHGYHITWQNKKVFYRSSYELNYAKLLDSKKIIYEMESLRIVYWDNQLNKQRVAIPDFYLKESNKIIEIKCLFYFDKQNMIDKFFAYKKHGFLSELIMDGKNIDLF